VLDGDAEADLLAGGPGADTLAGGADGDTLEGGAGDDALAGGPGADRLSGGDGADAADGGDGGDYLGGDGGPDRLAGGPGLDVFSGDDGDDLLLTRDGLAEPLITCGAGTDAVVADARDTVQPNCESVDDGTARPPAPPPPAAPQADVTPPRLRLVLSPRRFAAHRSGSTTRKRRGRRGARLRYQLSEPATLTITVQRLRGGRVKPLRGRVTLAGRAGPNRAGFSGRLSGRALRPGLYRLSGRARDAAGNVSRVSRQRFRIAREP